MSDKQLMRDSFVRSDQRRNGYGEHRSRQAGSRRSCTARSKLFLGLLSVLVVAALLIGFFVARPKVPVQSEPPDPVTSLPPSPSKYRTFKRAAVCTDAPRCSEIGRDVLSRNGSAVDAAIAAMFCNGLLNQQSMGVGGGFFMVVYVKREERAYSVAARETAPGAATRDMFHGNFLNASKGGLSVGVPGEVRGLWEAHQRWGRLPWSSLIAPAIDLCRSGYNMSMALYDGVMLAKDFLKYDHHLGKLYYNYSKDDYYPPGTMIKPPPELCVTLQRIAERGGDDFYNGSLAADLLKDLKSAGSIITAQDLENYKPKISDPIMVPLKDGDTLYTSPPPSSGVLLANILNVISAYNFSIEDIKDANNKILTYHRILETFKYVYATRAKLGDGDFLDLRDLISKAVSPEYALEIKNRINDSMTSNDTSTYGADEYVKPDSGTAHISIISEDGDAVSVTSSINFYFGACFMTKTTGIVMNNVMDDFASPGIINYFGVKPSPSNFIEPGKRPVSSMSPSIIVDGSRNAKLVIGASGGTRINTGMSWVAMHHLWFGRNLKEAVDAPRLHHQIFPMDAEYEYGITEDIVNGLRAKGHGLVRRMKMRSIVCALSSNGSAIFGNADFRKGGDVAGSY